MLVQIRNPTPKNHCSSVINPILNKKSKPSKTLIIKMSSDSNSNPKRRVCSSCSKPISVCFCNRIQNPGIENPVSVTILQHSLEKKHPLNSARIVKLGLKNVTVVNVTDVGSDVRFEIRLLNCCSDGVCGNVSMTSNSNIGIEQNWHCLETDDHLFGTPDTPLDNVVLSPSEYHENEDPVMVASVAKYGFKCSLSHKWASQVQDFNGLLSLSEAFDTLSKGFSVKKIQTRRLNESIELEEYEEYDLVIPPGSILLFPSDESLSVEALTSAEFKVRNLIVLDGTWAKAKRMYSENPWLKLLPHLKLDLNKMSLYSEVRIQPKAGYLSTIESIVYALKALGDDNPGLDNLLDVFESMVRDQRRCKDERLQKLAAHDQ